MIINCNELKGILESNRQTGTTTTLAHACRMVKYFKSGKNAEFLEPIILCANSAAANLLRKEFDVKACSVYELERLRGSRNPILIDKEVIAALFSTFDEIQKEQEKRIIELEKEIKKSETLDKFDA